LPISPNLLDIAYTYGWVATALNFKSLALGVKRY
jgi:hypothetical protein